MMATTAIWKVSDNLKRVLNYTSNPAKTKNDGLKDVIAYTANDLKTEKQFYVSGVNVDVEDTFEQMMLTKITFNKTEGIIAFHAYQSFAPNEVTPETAHKIGIELAQQMWGDRFEVLVSTHLDREHYHNHFVINSVSFKDGKKYYDNKKNYRQIRLFSDRLCEKYKLSVIEDSKSKGMYYAEWLAKNDDKPTKRKNIIDDVEFAINDSMTYTQFINHLKNKGYKIKQHVKYVAVSPINSEHYFRLRNLTKDKRYDEDNIKDRILQNSIVKMQPFQPKKIQKVIYKGNLSKARKIRGLPALYLHYLYCLGVLPKNRASKNRTHFLFKDDLLYLDKITKETTLLCRHHINTLEDLEKHKEASQDNIAMQMSQRQILYNKLRRCSNGEEKVEIKKQVKLLNGDIKQSRKEVVLYEGIKTRSVSIKTRLRTVNEEKRKERDINERRWRNR